MGEEEQHHCWGSGPVLLPRCGAAGRLIPAVGERRVVRIEMGLSIPAGMHTETKAKLSVLCDAPAHLCWPVMKILAAGFVGRATAIP